MREMVVCGLFLRILLQGASRSMIRVGWGETARRLLPNPSLDSLFFVFYSRGKGVIHDPQKGRERERNPFVSGIMSRLIFHMRRKLERGRWCDHSRGALKIQIGREGGEKGPPNAHARRVEFESLPTSVKGKKGGTWE